MIGSEFIKAAACWTAWRRQSYNGVNGMVGVLFVIRNRAQEWHEGNWLTPIGDLCSGPGYFTVPDVRHPEFQKVLETVDGIFNGQIEDKLTNGALYIGDGGTQRVAVIGNTSFYR